MPNESLARPQEAKVFEEDDEISLLDLLLVISENARLLIAGPIVAGLISLVVTFALKPVYTATTTIIPPSSGASGGTAAALLGQLGALGGAVSSALPSSGKHMAYLDSDLLRDEVIKKFDLQRRWDHAHATQTRNQLKALAKITEDKKVGVTKIEVTDSDPVFAAQVANEYVAVLGRLLGESALADARERRGFLETQIAEATKKTYQSPAVREAMIQSLIQQFERARIEEQQPNPSILQVDVAKPPDLKSGPKRALIAAVTSLATGFALLLFVFVRQAMRNASLDPESAAKLQKIQHAFRVASKFSKG